MTDSPTTASVIICETQPITAEGVKAVLGMCADLELAGAASCLQTGIEMVRRTRPAVLLVDKTLGLNALAQWFADLRTSGAPTAAVVWGASLSEAEALRLIQAGAKGVLTKSAEPDALIACLRAAAAGSTWMEDAIFREYPRPRRPSNFGLTPREQQVLELVEQGLKNSEIARELEISPGTVKIHLKHIFEKTGVRGRYGLALSGLRQKGMRTLIA